jgi:c-di-GMP-binding flagellar brake protein YcgR
VERRAHARFPKSFDIEGTSTTDDAVARMIASDLSLGGLYCTSTVDYPEMTRLAVRLMLPDEEDAAPEEDAFDIEAVVVRRKKLKSSTGNSKYELGLFFQRMTDEQRERIARFLAHS